MHRIFTLLLTATLTGIFACPPAGAQILQSAPDEVRNVGVDEHTNALLPLDEEFYDELGRKLPLGEYFRGTKPVLISFNYSSCPKLCDAQLTGLVRTLSKMELKPGRDFEYISISIDPSEKPTTARESRNKYVERYGDLDTKDGWHFLTGSQDAITRVTETTGFQYTFLPSRNEFSHAPIFVVCTPEGRISRYLYGIEIEPKTMRLSLVEASNGKIGGSMDQVILWCFNYDPDSNSYVLQAVNLMKVAGAATVVIIVAICIPFWFTRPRKKRDGNSSDGLTPEGQTDTEAEHAIEAPPQP